MRFIAPLTTVGFVLALPILLFTTNVRVLMSEVRFYERGLREYDAVATTGIALTELDRGSADIVHYFEDDAETLRIIVTEDGEEISLFNPQETIHMRDVKRLVRTVYRAHEVALGFVLLYIAGTVLWSAERSARQLARDTLVGVGVGGAVGLALGVLVIVGFDATWNQFHELVFPNDLWRLDPDTDHLIQMFPEAFWEEATLIVAALTLVQAGALVIWATVYLALSRPRPAALSRGVSAEEAQPQPQAPPPAQAQPPESASS